MSKSKNLISNTLILAAGTFASKIIVLLMTPIYTMLLSPAEFGAADLVAQTSNMIIPIACIGICEGLFRFTLDCEDKRRVFSTGIFTLLAGSAVMALCLPILSFFDIFDGYILLIGAYVTCANLHSACAQYIRAQGRTTLFAVQGIVNTVLTVVLNILFLVVFDLGAYGYVLSIVLGDLIVTVAIFLFARLYKDISPRCVTKQTLSEMLKFSIPYIPTTMLWLITSVSDRYIVRAFCGGVENGLYAAAYKIPTLLTLVCGVFIEAWQFSAVKDSDKEDRGSFFGGVYRYYLTVIFIAASVLIAGGKIFTRILLADSYFDSWSFVPILVMATVFSTLVSFLGSVYFVEKKSVYSMLTALVGALINIVLNFIMIPDHGAMGAAVATLISYMAVYIVRAIDTKRYIAFDLCTGKLVLNMALISLQTALMYIGAEYSWILQLACLLAILTVNAKAVFEIIRTFFSLILKLWNKKLQKK
ncbi:MAG: polysaccharide biosynthesis C-terminal domain-containing protein [Clostridia bacterium]|nr:polysaccharide biosynthesis C-terminal domain-containing protein [Clostridia bacterium]